MNTNVPLVVKKGGVLTALAHGVFGTIAVAIVCGAIVLLYGVNVVDRKSSQLLGAGTTVLSSLSEVRDALPPAIADVLADRRAPAYRNKIDVSATLLPNAGDNTSRRVTLNVTNGGEELVTMLAARIVLMDEAGHIVRSAVMYLATPLTIDSEWPGPIMPGTSRQCGLQVYTSSSLGSVAVEITDVRIWHEENDVNGKVVRGDETTVSEPLAPHSRSTY